MLSGTLKFAEEGVAPAHRDDWAWREGPVEVNDLDFMMLTYEHSGEVTTLDEAMDCGGSDLDARCGRRDAEAG
jgi:hypothetical protein